jgi:CheY-like chemotaxis protein
LDIPGSVEDAINWFRNNPAADIVFMDIQLEDGICFEILRKLKSEPTSFSPPRLTNMPLMRSKRTVWITC